MLPAAIDGSETRILKNQTTGSDLHVIASRGLVFSCWRPVGDELARMNAGEPIWVVIRGELVPEFNLTVGHRRTVVPPEIIRLARKQQAVLNSPEAGAYRAATARVDFWVEWVARFMAAVILTLGMGFLWVVWRFVRG